MSITTWLKDIDYRETGDPIWKYELLQEKVCTLRYKMDIKTHRLLPHQAQYFGVTHDGRTVILKKGYRWNGSNVVVDTRTDMRASAIHDLQAQMMLNGKIFLPTLSNWRRAAQEYASNCVQDGMARFRAWGLRFTGILVGGGNGYKWRGSLMHGF